MNRKLIDDIAQFLLIDKNVGLTEGIQSMTSSPTDVSILYETKVQADKAAEAIRTRFPVYARVLESFFGYPKVFIYERR